MCLAPPDSAAMRRLPDDEYAARAILKVYLRRCQKEKNLVSTYLPIYPLYPYQRLPL